MLHSFRRNFWQIGLLHMAYLSQQYDNEFAMERRVETYSYFITFPKILFCYTYRIAGRFYHFFPCLLRTSFISTHQMNDAGCGQMC